MIVTLKLERKKIKYLQLFIIKKSKFMKSFIILMLILISTQTNSFGNPIYILEVYENGDTVKYTSDEFMEKIQTNQISEQEEEMKLKLEELKQVVKEIKLSKKKIELKDEAIKKQERTIRTQKIEIISIISGIFGLVTFPLFVVFLILYIVTKGKLKKMSLE
jgi:hypothetical protein